MSKKTIISNTPEDPCEADQTNDLSSEAIEHDRWFREQVERALIEADDPETVWISHEDVLKSFQRQREVLEERIRLSAETSN